MIHNVIQLITIKLLAPANISQAWDSEEVDASFSAFCLLSVQEDSERRKIATG